MAVDLYFKYCFYDNLFSAEKETHLYILEMVLQTVTFVQNTTKPNSLYIHWVLL